MKISRPTNVTITSMTAVSGSSTQPVWHASAGAELEPAKLTYLLRRARRAGMPQCIGERDARSSSANTIAPMASEAANFAVTLLANALKPAASNGSAGISQRF